MHRNPGPRPLRDSGFIIAHEMVSADELPGLKPPPKAAPFLSEQDPDTRRPWKRFQSVTQLPEQDQPAVVRLVSSLVSAGSSRRNSAAGEVNAGAHNGC